LAILSYIRCLAGRRGKGLPSYTIALRIWKGLGTARVGIIGFAPHPMTEVGAFPHSENANALSGCAFGAVGCEDEPALEKSGSARHDGDGLLAARLKRHWRSVEAAPDMDFPQRLEARVVIGDERAIAKAGEK
jgi:hypothetical protein